MNKTLFLTLFAALAVTACVSAQRDPASVDKSDLVAGYATSNQGPADKPARTCVPRSRTCFKTTPAPGSANASRLLSATNSTTISKTCTPRSRTCFGSASKTPSTAGMIGREVVDANRTTISKACTPRSRTCFGTRAKSEFTDGQLAAADVDVTNRGEDEDDSDERIDCVHGRDCAHDGDLVEFL